MNKIHIVLLLIFTIFTVTVSLSSAAGDKDVDSILFSAESLFKMMKERNYPRIWFFLSNTSQTAIIDDTYKNMLNYAKQKGKEMTYSKEQIKDNFKAGDVAAQAYWNSYLNSFDPDMVLEKSKWEMGRIDKERAQINIMYKKSEKPAIIQMYKENGVWRVGLTETFKSAKR